MDRPPSSPTSATKRNRPSHSVSPFLFASPGVLANLCGTREEEEEEGDEKRKRGGSIERRGVLLIDCTTTTTTVLHRHSEEEGRKEGKKERKKKERKKGGREEERESAGSAIQPASLLLGASFSSTSLDQSSCPLLLRIPCFLGLS